MNSLRPPDKNGRPRNNLKALKTAQALIEDNLPKLAEKTLQLALMGDTVAVGAAALGKHAQDPHRPALIQDLISG